MQPVQVDQNDDGQSPESVWRPPQPERSGVPPGRCSTLRPEGFSLRSDGGHPDEPGAELVFTLSPRRAALVGTAEDVPRRMVPSHSRWCGSEPPCSTVSGMSLPPGSDHRQIAFDSRLLPDERKNCLRLSAPSGWWPRTNGFALWSLHSISTSLSRGGGGGVAQIFDEIVRLHGLNARFFTGMATMLAQPIIFWFLAIFSGPRSPDPDSGRRRPAAAVARAGGARCSMRLALGGAGIAQAAARLGWSLSAPGRRPWAALSVMCRRKRSGTPPQGHSRDLSSIAILGLAQSIRPVRKCSFTASSNPG